MNLFVLVSTGQKVANLPPVLEHAHPGDHVLWVESREARDRNWTAPPRTVLEERGLVTADTISVPHVNDPATLAEAVKSFALAARGQYDTVYLVANGGTKLSPVGLLFGLEVLSPRMLYGDEKPAVHSLYPAGLGASPEPAAYTRHDLDLPDILRLNGYTFWSKSPHVRIWPEQLPPDWATEPYGLDEAHTYELHARHHARATAPPAGARVPFAALASLVPNALTKWNGAVRDVRQHLTPQTQTALYNSTLKLDEAARRSAGAAAAGGAPPGPIDGPFERAVARRLRSWLAAAPHPAVRSVWADVVVARETAPHREQVQFDVLVVLTNGVLFHLECKSALVDVRDLDARIHRLRETGSQLARLAVVLPIYTRRSDRSWFATADAARTDVEQARLTVLPFTWPGQPERYLVPGSEPPAEAACPPFEAALHNLLSDYRPAVGSTPA